MQKLASRQGRPLEGPVRIVAGGCDPAVEQQMKAYRDLLLEAFRDFHGTVLGGGTREGISGLVGEVGEAYRGAIRTIGYLPKLIPADATADQRYCKIRKTDGSGFSSSRCRIGLISLPPASIRPMSDCWASTADRSRPSSTGSRWPWGRRWASSRRADERGPSCRGTRSGGARGNLSFFPRTRRRSGHSSDLGPTGCRRISGICWPRKSIKDTA